LTTKAVVARGVAREGDGDQRGEAAMGEDALDAGAHQNPNLQAGQSMPEKTRQELLQPFLAVVAQRLLARKTGRPFSVHVIGRLLREVIQ
jgi:hypothetical protein